MQPVSALQENLINRIAIGDIFRRRAADAANNIAVSQHWASGVSSISYKSLNEKLNQFVWALRNKGVQQGDKVAILGANSINFYIAVLGCYKGGFIAVPINTLQSADDLSYIINHAEAKAVYFDLSLAHVLIDIIDQLQPVLACSLSGADSKVGPVSLEALIDKQPTTEIDDIIIDDQDPAQIMYTSGTTSRPKGVVASHKSLFLSSISTFMLANIKPDSTNQYVALPLFHLTALSFSLLTLHTGGTVVLVDGFDAEKALQLFQDQAINVTVLIPLMWQALLNADGRDNYDYSALACGFYGMAPMPQSTLQSLFAAFSCPFILASGQTEIAGACTALSQQWSESKQGNYWGDGSVFCDQAIMDDEGNLLAANEVGEIVWRSPLVMNHYYKNPEATLETQQFGWHHSGDLGFIDSDNQLCFVDRKKDIIKTGGENVSSVSVERVILSIDGVSNVAVIGLPHKQWGEAVVAVVVSNNSALTEAQVIQHCKTQLGGFQVPKRIIFSDTLPATATGKIQKPELRARYQDLF